MNPSPPVSNNAVPPGLLNLQGGMLGPSPGGLLGLAMRAMAGGQAPAPAPADPEADLALARMLGLLPQPVVASNGEPRS